MSFLSSFFSLKTLFEKDSVVNGRVKVFENAGVRSLTINGYTQSRSLRDGISGGYWDQFLEVAEGSAIVLKKVLILGFGAGTAAILFGQKYSEIEIDAVEIDPVVVDASKIVFDFTNINLNVVIGDATKIVLEGRFKSQDYEVVVIDLYENGSHVPPVVYTVEYLEKIKNLLKPNGVLMFNQIFQDNFRKEYYHLEQALKKVFGNCFYKDVHTSNNVIIYATN